VDVSPDIQADLCGTGIGVLGTGSTATCNGTQSASGGAGGGLLGILPNLQLGVCGNGVGVLGAGSTAKCDTSASAGNPGSNPGTDPGGNSGGGPGADGGGSVLGDVAGAAGTVAAVPGDLARGSLAFTGANPVLTALLGLGLAGAGAAMLRLRRFGYKG
jgi:hypothetical protein